MNTEPLLTVADEVMLRCLGRHLTDVETAILLGAIADKTYEQIADASGYSVSYVKRDVGPKLWRFLSEALGEDISKTNFRAALDRYADNKAAEVVADRVAVRKGELLTITLSANSQVPVVEAQIDWGEAADVSVFYGRTEELKTLTQWVMPLQGDSRMTQAFPCRLLAILGMGGIGKSALSVKLAQQLVESGTVVKTAYSAFEYVIWRSLRNAPPLETLLADLVPFLSGQKDSMAETGQLLQHLRDRRCLVILDNLETILDTERPGLFRVGYENYGELLRLIGEINHLSCVILTSREKPAIVAALEGEDAPVRSLRLQGAPEIAQALLHAKKLKGNDTQKQMLCDRYSNSPLALKIVSTTIQDLFDSDIAAFLQEETIVFNGIRRLLDSQFERLSPLEQNVMYWLAINREWTTIAELQEDILPPVPKARILEVLESLNGRSLVERQANQYTQQPVVMEYVTDCLTSAITTELITAELSLFVSHALLKTTLKEYIRESQIRLILEVIASNFQSFSSLAVQEQQVLQILAQLRRSQLSVCSYGGGNLLNLCQALKLDLSGQNFSNLTIRHADLSGKVLRQVDFTDATFYQSSFTQTFGNILTLHFSPDGKLLATGDTSSRICLWRVADGQMLHTLADHEDWVRSLRFSANAAQPNSPFLVSGSDDQTIRLWQINALEESFTADGMASVSVQCISVLNENPSRASSIAIWVDGRAGASPQGETLIASSSEDHTVWLWLLDSSQKGKVLTTQVLRGHRGQVWAVDFALLNPADPQSVIIASSGEDACIKLWNRQGECLRSLEGHTNWITRLAFSPDGQRLASASDDRTVKLWDAQTGICLHTLEGHTDKVAAVAFSSDGQWLASAGTDTTIRVWNLASGQCHHVLVGHHLKVWEVAFSPTQPHWLASGSDDQTVRLWDVQAGQCLKTLRGHTQGIWSVAISPDGQTLASSGDEQVIRLWNRLTGKEERVLSRHMARIESVDFSPNGRLLVSCGEDTTARLWDVQTGECLKVLPHSGSQVWEVAFSPRGDLVASGSEDYQVRLWDVQTGECLRVLSGHTGWVWQLVFSPDGQWLASAGYDHTIKLWNVETGECLKTLVGQGNTIIGLAVSPDGRMIASSGYSNTIRLWDVETGICLQEWQAHDTLTTTVNFSPDGQMLVSTGVDQVAKLWTLQGECLKTLTGHTSMVWGSLFSRDGQQVITSSWDETLKIWDVETGHCLKTLRAERPYEGTKITGAVGITAAQKASLSALGAIIEPAQSTAFDRPVPEKAQDKQVAASPPENPPTGTVTLTETHLIDRIIYVERSPTESICYETLVQPGSLIRIKAPKLMGKTSLINRVLSQIEREGYRVVSLSFELADKSIHFTELHKFMRWFCATLSRELGLPNEIDEYWEDELGAKISCTTYLEDYLLPQANASLVLALDDVDLLFPHPTIYEDFFSLLRAWHEKAKSRPIWKRLRLLLAHTTDVYIPLDINQSPFNVGTPIELSEFTTEQVESFAQQFGLENRLIGIEPLINMVGGHPYLLEQAFTYLKNHPQVSLEHLLAAAPTEAGIYQHHLRDRCLTLQKYPELMNAFKAIVSASTLVAIEPNTTYHLQCMGLVKFVGNQVTPRCKLYQQYFAERL